MDVAGKDKDSVEVIEDVVRNEDQARDPFHSFSFLLFCCSIVGGNVVLFLLIFVGLLVHMVLSKNSCSEILVGTTGPLCEDDWNAGSRKLRGSDAEASDALFHDVLLVPLGNVLL